MNHHYNDVLGRISGLRAASNSLRMIDDMIMNVSDAEFGAKTPVTSAEKLQSHLGLVEQLADMVTARRAHRANNHMLAVTDALLDKLSPM